MPNSRARKVDIKEERQTPYPSSLTLYNFLQLEGILDSENHSDIQKNETVVQKMQIGHLKRVKLDFF